MHVIGVVTLGPQMRNGVVSIELDREIDVLATNELATYAMQMVTVGRTIYVRGDLHEQGPFPFIRAREVVA